jgi:ribosomal-protein-serine acetyltransferase
MTGQENNRPNELIEHAPVTLRRFRAEDVDALFDAVTESLEHLRPWMPWAADPPPPSGTGTGVVWHLTR